MNDSETKLQQIICNAIKQRKVLSFYYESSSGNYWRKVAPYILAIKDNGKGNIFFTGYVYPSKERKSKANNDDQGHYLLNKIDLNKFEISDETFNELKLPYDRIFGELPTIKIICKVSSILAFALKKKLHTAEGEMHLKIDVQIESGKLVSLYGASGAGKTSVLRMLAGFMKPDSGCIKMNDAVWFDNKKHMNIQPQQRSIGFVFQDYALFPNMNVRENITFALNKKEGKSIIDELLELTGLMNLESRKTETLSGGQKQRVALARALAKKPSLLLLDEPLSAIDHAMRAQLQTTLLEVHKRFALTTILVSHDMDEIIKLSDAIIHLEHGIVQQNTTPAQFFLNGHKMLSLTGNIVSITGSEKGTSTVVLINNRILEINSGSHDVPFKIGEKVEIIYENDEPLIRKL